MGRHFRRLIGPASLATILACALDGSAQSVSAGRDGRGQRSPVAPEVGSLTVAFPPVRSVAGKRAFTCLSLMETDLTASADTSLTDGIEGKVTAGKNGASLSINDSTLTFLSDAAAKSGETEGASFKIIRNDRAELVAYFFDGISMSSFVLNKDNGLAIWSKIRSTFRCTDGEFKLLSLQIDGGLSAWHGAEGRRAVASAGRQRSRRGGPRHASAERRSHLRADARRPVLLWRQALAVQRAAAIVGHALNSIGRPLECPRTPAAD